MAGSALKHLSKTIRIELYPLELEEFNGDKEAYFLSEFQTNLAENYVAQFGRDRKTIVIYEKNTVYAQWQCRIPHSFRRFLIGDTKSVSVVMQVPKTYLATRMSQRIIVEIRKTKPLVGTNMQVLTELIHGVGKKLAIWNEKDQTFEIYEYSKWQIVGIRYRSER